MDRICCWITIAFFITAIAVSECGGSSFMSPFAKRGSTKYRDLSAKCQDEKGRCLTFAACDTVSHIYKGYCKTDYSQVCCVPRATVCDAHDGICTDDPEACEAAGAIMGIKYQIQFKTWLTCNATHTCCRPMPQGKSDMDDFKSQFPERQTNSVAQISVPAPAPAPPPVQAPAPAPAPPPPPIRISAAPKELSDDERQSLIGEAVLAVLAENPSMSLKQAMQHPSVRIAAGEPPIQSSPVITSPNVGAQYEAARRQRAAMLIRQRRLMQLRQAEAAREIAAQQQQQQLIQQQQNQQLEGSIFPGHMIGDAVNSEINKRLYSTGPQFGNNQAYPSQQYFDPMFNSGEMSGAYDAGFYPSPYQKQGTKKQAQFQRYTNRLLGEVKLPPQSPSPSPSDDKYGFKDNADFLPQQSAPQSYNTNRYVNG